MSWEISISAEGWNDIYQTLHQLTFREKLVEAIVNDEWTEDLGLEGFDTLKQKYTDTPLDVLADVVYSKIEEINTCDNGGNGYWMDREGYCQLYTERFDGERLAS
jgi:hypothetical protein